MVCIYPYVETVFVHVCVETKLITCERASTTDNARREMLNFSSQHWFSPLNYCNPSEVTWCGCDLSLACGRLFIH